MAKDLDVYPTVVERLIGTLAEQKVRGWAQVPGASPFDLRKLAATRPPRDWRAEIRLLSDADVYRSLVHAAFSPGVHPAPKAVRPLVELFDDPRQVAYWPKGRFEQVLAQPAWAKQKAKLELAHQNAEAMVAVGKQHGGFHAYFDALGMPDPPRPGAKAFDKAAARLKADFKFPVNGLYDFLAELGVPAFRPDPTVARILERIGLTDPPSTTERAAEVVYDMAELLELPVLLLGQALADFTAICAASPKCGICREGVACDYFTTKVLPTMG